MEKNTNLFHHFIRWATGKYTPIETKQVDVIRNLYTQIFKKVPKIFRNKPDKIPGISLESFRTLDWEEEIGQVLNGHFKEIINTICNYQTQRNAENRGYCNDPTTLFLHELKKNIVLMSKGPLISSRSLAEKWLNFITKLWIADEFPAKSNHELTMKGTLKTIRSSLMREVIPALDAEITSSSALEHLSSLSWYLKNFFEDSLRFLFFIYSDGLKPEQINITLKDFKNPTLALVKTRMETFLGKLIGLLANSPHNLELIQKNLIESEQAIALEKAAESEKNIQLKEIDEAAQTNALKFLNSNVILQFETKKDVKNSVFKNLLSSLFRQPENLGIAKAFQKIEHTSNILRCLIWSQEIAKFCHIFLLAKDCAKYGGNILIYGFCNQAFIADLDGNPPNK